MASHTPNFPEPQDERPKKPPKTRTGPDLKDPFWWAVGGVAFMAFALAFLLLVARP